MTPPPIDTAQLRARAAEIGRKFGDLDSLQIALRLLLLDYADSSRRNPTPLPGETAHTTYGVALPVLRAVVNALRKRAMAAPLAALVLIDRLWQAGSAEERRIAAELFAVVAPQAQPAALRLVDAWLARLSDGEGADVLASVAMAPLLQADPAARLEDIARWLAAPNEWARRFAAMAVAALGRAKSYHNPVALLEALRSAMADPAPEVRRGVVTALWQIAPQDPGEFARFMQPYTEEDDPATRWIVRQALNGLPTATQRSVNALLREG